VGKVARFGIENDFKLTVDRRKIVMDNPIKTYGTYTYDVKLYPEIAGKITVVVTD
jgi:large subunit ribosomal protein L9